jgi:hypothetical protein
MKTNYLLRSVLLPMLLGFCSTVTGNNVLFSNGKTSYQIVISENASVSEQTAAKELQQYVAKISGAQLPISKNLNVAGPKIFVGYNAVVGKIIGTRKIPADYEGFTYRCVGKNLLIYGGSGRGTMYGVFRFLEQQLGVRWYTPEITKVPQQSTWSFDSKLKHSEQPAIGYRYSNYYVAGKFATWSAHNEENMKWVPVENEYGNLEAYWNCHTMGQLISSDEFFKDHPEYFALRDGKRINNGQLCLSNPKVLALCKERLLQKMREQPNFIIYSLSQNDNTLFCECPQCKALEEQYGGHSGLILWFVNQVADTVKTLFPQKYVGTFAYQYTRKPPVGIVPRSNVVIRLCSIECCFAHPLTAGCPQNQSFMDDMTGWSQIAPHLFIWDYVVDYAQYIAPWPNFQVLGPNIQTFRENHAIGIFEEAQYQSAGGEFDEMKSWVLTKLLWNPQQDVNALVKDYIYGVYGKAAPKVMAYYLLCQSLVKPETHFGIYIREQDPIYSDEFIEKGMDLLDDAKKAADNADIAARVDRVNMQLLYLQSVRDPEGAKSDGTWAEFVRLARLYKARPNESQNLETFIEEMEKKK